jgi:hypothetical protein
MPIWVFEKVGRKAKNAAFQRTIHPLYTAIHPFYCYLMVEGRTLPLEHFNLPLISHAPEAPAIHQK